MTDTVKVVFTPSGHRGEFPVGTSLLDAARRLGVDLDSICGGRGLCGRCQIVCTSGSFPKHSLVSDLSHLSPISATEIRYSEKKKPLAHNRRLGCHTLLLDDVVIDIPPESQVHQQVIRKEAEHRDIELDPLVRLCAVQVSAPELEHSSSDLERLVDALQSEWQVTVSNCDVSVLSSLQAKLRAKDWFVTAAIHQESEIIALWPGLHERVFGLAIDVGSTTVAGHLCDLTTGEVCASGSLMNPQIRFGEDLMSRVSWVMMHPEGAAELTRVIREGLNQLVAQVVDLAGITATDILEVTLVANPVMHHILLGISPVELGGAPFALTLAAALHLKANDLALDINPGGRIYILPCIAGHVGADTAGMILSEAPYEQEQLTLLIDVGTNAEIVLGNSKRLMACSSPTGPAFEGAQISCGQRAAVGAIERVRIDPISLAPRVKVIGGDLWSDEDGFTEQASRTGVTGICGSGIIEAVAEMYLAGIISAEGVIVSGVDAELSGGNPRLVADGRTWSYLLYDGEVTIKITQNDIRQIQLAKAALYAGIKLLTEHFFVEGAVETVDRIRLAGAFGSHIDVTHAMIMGLIPDCELENVSSAGNAAGTGARIALLNKASRQEIESLVRRIEKIETATAPRFQEFFVEAMAFPHQTDPFTKLFSQIDKPLLKNTEKAMMANLPTSNKSSRRNRRRSRQR